MVLSSLQYLYISAIFTTKACYRYTWLQAPLLCHAWVVSFKHTQQETLKLKIVTLIASHIDTPNTIIYMSYINVIILLPRNFFADM